MTRTGRLASSLALAAAALTALACLARAGRPKAVSWRGRVAVITGGARGLGLALARELCADGVVVWLVSRSQDQLTRAVDQLRAGGAEAHAHACDVTQPDAVAQMVDAIIQRHGRLDVVINNAGVMTAMPFHNAAVSDFEESLATHFWAPLHVIRAALPWLRRAHPGHIVNISSIGGRVGVPHLAPYCAGKFALTGLSEVLRAELARDHVWVTTVTPGLMRTGSVGQVKVRGRHEAEATWFAAMAATPVTSMSAAAAARAIVDAAKRGRAAATPGWQARTLHGLNAVAPELTAASMELVAAAVLPAAVPGPSDARTVKSLHLGWGETLLSPSLEVAYNQR